ncbi:MAG TPA: hypothetical protein VFO54_06810 [Chryseosolibacter sp.]|nr:hypothetical protein [Chryseosolibacter sp.]
MKNIFKFLCVVVLVFAATFASGQGRYSKGDVLLNAGIGLDHYYGGGVPLVLSAEFAVNDVISIGPYLGYTSYNYNYGFGGYKYRYTFLDIGVRGSYHFSELFEIRNEQVDVYGGLFLGYLISSYSGDTFTGYNDPYGSSLRLGIHAGVRYFFNEKVAGYAELGYGIAPLSLGVTFKL